MIKIGQLASEIFKFESVDDDGPLVYSGELIIKQVNLTSFKGIKTNSGPDTHGPQILDWAPKFWGENAYIPNVKYSVLAVWAPEAKCLVFIPDEFLKYIIFLNIQFSFSYILP